MKIVPDSPGASNGIYHVPFPESGAGDASTKVTSVEYVSLIQILLALAFPVFVYVIVYIIVSFQFANGGAVFVISTHGLLTMVISEAGFSVVTLPNASDE